MKFRSLHKWDNTQNSEGLIFVAQLIDELLFEFTLDTYKPSAMNTSLLVREAVTTIKAIEKGTIKKPNLKHILNELCENLERDMVAISLMSVDLNGVKAMLKDPKTNDHSLLTTVELLWNQIPLLKYKERNEELLISELEGEKNKSSLRSLTRSYITTLLNSGFSEIFIRKESQRFFFYSDQRITGNEMIKDYFEIFEITKREYKVVYRAPVYLEQFKKAAAKLDIQVVQSIPELDEKINEMNFSLRQDEVFLFIEEIKCSDSFIAKKISDSIVEQFQTLIGLYHHKESPTPIIESLVINSDNLEFHKVRHSVNPMHKCHDLKAGTASKRLLLFMNSFSMKKDSFRKFNRSAELHALALSSESRENQMINLWISLESLIPAKDENDKKSQIEHLSGSILPFLNLGYIEKLVSRLSKDLLFWNSRLTKQVLKDIDAVGIVNKTAHLLALDEYQEQRNTLEASFRDFHLLNDRYKYLRYLLTSPSNIAAALDAHTKRVDWQIRRIYRARNMIVHDGITPSYIEVLIENTHDYLDSVMSSIMNLASKSDTLDSIDQGFKMMELNYLAYSKSLNAKGISFSKENIDDLLFSHPI